MTFPCIMPFSELVWSFQHRGSFKKLSERILVSINSRTCTGNRNPWQGVGPQPLPIKIGTRNSFELDLYWIPKFVLHLRLRGQGLQEGSVIGMFFVLFRAHWLTFTSTFHCALSTWVFRVLLLPTCSPTCRTITVFKVVLVRSETGCPCSLESVCKWSESERGIICCWYNQLRIEEWEWHNSVTAKAAKSGTCWSREWST